jgi:probable F420-dependent oxidoreductase
MRFTLLEPTALSPHHLLHLAVAAERCGFDAVALNDGTFQIRGSRGVYPYSADHRPNWDLAAPFYEPMTLLPAVAMAVPRLRFVTSVIKLPLRHPLTLAKQVATAAIMSGDRFVLGVGASWAPEEYEYCGVDWATRGTRMLESVEALRLLLSGEWVSYDGATIRFGPVICRPAPRIMPRILFGGHHEASLRRAARLGDGWIAGPVASFEELAGLVSRLHALMAQAGRDASDFEVHAPPPAGALGIDAYRRLEDLGVTDAVTLPIDAGGELLIDEATRQRLRGEPVAAAEDPAVLYSAEPPATKLEAVERFAERVIAAWR